MNLPPVEFLRAGFLTASETFDPKALDVDVSGKNFMITGANTGIGKAVTLAVAKRGGTIHMMCLYIDEDARKEIVESSGNKNVHMHVLDLSQPKRVYQFAKQFVESQESLHVLVNCAGCMPVKRQLTDDGLEMCFAVNSMGPYILTTTLLPLLSKTPGSRVITVASAALLYHNTDTSDLQSERMQPYDKLNCYAKSKRHQVVMTEIWARRFPSIHFSAMHPGVAETGLMLSTIPELHASAKGQEGVFRTPEQGADTVVWLGISEAAARHASGKFYFDRKLVPVYLPNRDDVRSTDEENQLLMDALEKIATEVTGRTQ